MSFGKASSSPSGLKPPPPAGPPTKAKMGKKKSDIYSCFQILPVKNKANKSIFMCKFCDRQYLQNATKMESHIVTQCQKVPPQVRTSYAKVPGGGPRSTAVTTTTTSSPASDNSDSRPQTPINLSQLSAANRGRQATAQNNTGVRGQNQNNNNSNSIVIKRAGGTLVSHRVTPHSDIFQQQHQRNSVQQQHQKRPRLTDGVNNNNNQYQQNNNQKQNNHSKGGSNNNTNFIQRHQIISNNNNNNHKRVATSAGVGKSLHNNINNNNIHITGRSNSNIITAISNQDPVVDHKQMVDIWRLLAKGIYATGCPLSILKNEYWAEAFKKIRPALTLPTTHALSTTLLNEEYQNVRKDIQNKITNSNFVTLQCESHPGINEDENILSFFVTTPAPLLYRTVTLTTEEISTKEKLIEAISSTIDEIGCDKVLAFISDLTPGMKYSWEMLRSKYPGLLTFGCILQGLNILLDEFLEETSIHDLCHKGKIIVDKTKASSPLKKKFQEIQRQLKLAPVASFKFSSKSRWSSLAKSLTLLISQKAAFKELISCAEAKNVFEQFEYEILEDEDFWRGIHSVTQIIVPLSNWIKIMEVDSSPSISLLPQIFHDLKSAYENNLKNLPSELEESFLKQLNQTRRLCMNELHYAACLLNPKLKANGIYLNEDEQEEGSEFIHYFCETRDLDAQTSLKELKEYRSNTGIFSKSNVWKLAESVEPVSWWNSVRPGSALTAVAQHLLTIAPPLSTFDPKPLFVFGNNVPSTNSNLTAPGVSLEKEKLDKLAFIKYHLQQPKTIVPIKTLLPLPEIQSVPIVTAVPGMKKKVSEDWNSSNHHHQEFKDFKLEEQEPMDVTQFLSQTTHAGIYTDSEDEEEEAMDMDTKSSKNLNTNSILSNLMMGVLPKGPTKALERLASSSSEDEEEEDVPAVVVANNNHNNATINLVNEIEGNVETNRNVETDRQVESDSSSDDSDDDDDGSGSSSGDSSSSNENSSTDKPQL